MSMELSMAPLVEMLFLALTSRCWPKALFASPNGVGLAYCQPIMGPSFVILNLGISMSAPTPASIVMLGAFQGPPFLLP